MQEKQESDQPQIPSIEEFEAMDVADKVRVFTSLPIKAQLVLVSLSAYTDSVSDGLFQQIRDPLTAKKRQVASYGRTFNEEAERKRLHWTPEEFDQAMEFLVANRFMWDLDRLDVRESADKKQGWVSISHRYAIKPVIKEFINTDLRKVWEEQKKREQKK